MNTADRSIGHIDYAIRRRFAFHTLLPDRQAIIDSYGNNSNLSTLAVQLFDETKKVFTSSELAECTLSPDYSAEDVCIGHSYFMAQDEQELSLKLRCQVIPILREYFKDGVLIEKRRKTTGRVSDLHWNSAETRCIGNANECCAKCAGLNI